MSDWLLRDATEDDAHGIVALWLESAWRSRYGKRWHFDGGRSEFNDRHKPRLERVLERATVRLACDPEAPGVFWAFAVTEPARDVVHYILAKRSFHRANVSAEMFRDLLGSMLIRPCTCTHELIEFQRAEVVAAGLTMPPSWRLDEYALNETRTDRPRVVLNPERAA